MLGRLARSRGSRRRRFKLRRAKRRLLRLYLLLRLLELFLHLEQVVRLFGDELLLRHRA